MPLDFAYLASRDGLLDRRLPYGRVGRGAIELKTLHELLSGGAWLRHTGDVADPDRGFRGRILGRRVRFVRAPWVLSQTTGAPILPIALPVGDDLRPRLHIGTPIVVARGPGACEEALQRFLDFLVEVVGDAVWNFHPRVWAPWFTGEPT
jgi:hypothetical protein